MQLKIHQGENTLSLVNSFPNYQDLFQLIR